MRSSAQALIAFACFAPTLVEALLLWLAPHVLARLAFLPLPGERRVALPPAPRVPAEDPSYRSEALKPGPGRVPPLHFPRVELTDALLVGAGNGLSFGLRRFFLGRTSVSRRPVWLVRIDARVVGEEVLFRARQALGPITFPIAGAVWFAANHAPLPVIVLPLGFFTALLAVMAFLNRKDRDLAIREAFDVLERELRKTFPKPEADAQPRAQPPSQP
jgi:hypothetical protein